MSIDPVKYAKDRAYQFEEDQQKALDEGRITEAQWFDSHKQFFTAARKKRLISENPFDGIPTSTVSNSKRLQFISHEDIQKVLNEFSVEEMNIYGFDLPDPLAMAVAIDPAVATKTKHLYVAIETDSKLCRGQTVVDHLGVTKLKPNVEVVLEASREKFLRILYDSVR